MKKKKAKQLIEDRIRIWNSYEHLKVLSEILVNDEQILVSKLVKIPDKNDSLDQARQMIAEYAMKKVHPNIDVRHFIFQGHSETTQIVFEDTKGIRDNDTMKIVFDNIVDVMMLITECLAIDADNGEFIEFTRFFLDDPVNAASKDHAMRYKTSLWFSYMLLEIIKLDSMACKKGALFFEKWVNTTKGHPACDQRKAFILSQIEFIVKDIHYFEISCRLYQLGRLYDALILIDVFKEKYPSREVFNLSGLIHFQIAFKALLKCDKNKALRFWLSSILDTTTLATTTLRSAIDTDFCPEMAEYKIHKEAALRDLEIACQKDPFYLPSRLNFSSALILNGNYVAALAELDAFYKRDNTNADIAANRACALYLIGPTIQVDTLNQAVELSEVFIQKEVNKAQVLYNLYRMFEERGRESKALEIKNRFLEIQPNGLYASMIRKKPLNLQKKNSANDIQFWEKCPVKMGLPDDQTSNYLSRSKAHEFNFGTLSGQIHEIDHNRVLVLDDVVEMAEVKPHQKYSENEILAHYGQPLRAIKTYCETKVMIYQNFAVDIVDEMVHKVVYFENNVQ
ncbi:MAG: hypothetical protein HQK75_16380 [Candidatus Magnetomorum sp.]|nr:hypothetical protein [Candidatus Magnetomorum sp.]